MATRKLNRQDQIAPELALAQGPMPMSRLGGEIVDEAMLLDGYDAHLQLLENRPKTTAGTYRSHVNGFLRYMAINYPSVALCEVTKLQVRAWFLHEANRGIAPVTRSTKLFAVRSFYRFLITEDLSEENPASLVTPRVLSGRGSSSTATPRPTSSSSGRPHNPVSVGRWAGCSS